MTLLRGKPTSDTVWALFEQGATLVASTLSFLLLGRTLGVTGYGAFVGLYALIGPFSALSQSGVFLAAMEHVVREGEDPIDVARSCLSLTVVNALVWVPVLSGVALNWIAGIPAFTVILLVGTEFFLSGVLSMSIGMVQAVTGLPAAARLRITGAVLRIGLLATLAAVGSLTLTTLAVGQVVTLGSLVVYAIAKVSRLTGAPARPGRIRWKHVRSTALYGLGIAASMAQSDGDKFALNAAHHQADAGRYGAAYRLMQIALLPVNVLVSATHLSFLHSAEGPNAQLRRSVRLSLVTLAYAVPAAIGLVIAAPLIPKILSKGFSDATLILQLLAPVVILRGVGVYPMNGLMGLGRNALRTKLLMANALFSLVLYATLIPGYAWQGALAATLASETTLCASGWVALLLCQRNRKVVSGKGDPSPPDIGCGKASG